MQTLRGSGQREGRRVHNHSVTRPTGESGTSSRATVSNNFTNRRRTHAKILWFDGTGLCMYAKRLEKGRFAALWDVTTRKQIALKRSELQLFLEGSHLVGRISVSPDNLSPSDLVPRPRV